MRYACAISFAAAFALATAGCEPLECAEGTTEEGGQCIALLAPRCAAGTELRAGECVPSGGGAECGPGTHADDGACVPDLIASANATRMTRVSNMQPLAFANVATTPINAALSSGDALVFLAVYQPYPEAVRLYGGDGASETDGSFSLAAERAFDIKAAVVAGDSFTSEPFAMYFPVFGSTPLRLENTVLSDVNAPLQNRVPIALTGTLTGVITPENAREVFIELANETLDVVLETIGLEPDTDLDGDGTDESWSFAFDFETEPVWLF